MSYVPRHDRPARMAALAAFQHFLAKHPDLRIGQALLNLVANRHDDAVWALEDEDLLDLIVEYEKANP